MYKKILPLFALLALLASCEKDPDTNELDNSYIVLTNYDAGADFKDFDDFYVIDSILMIDDHAKPTYWKNANSQRVVDAFNNKFLARGYTQADNGDDADMVLQLSYVSNTYYFANSAGPWWYNYPGYWNWGGGWYYPFSFYYSYSTGSFIGELVDNKNVRSDKKLTVIWNTYISNLLEGNNLSYFRTISAINQAFVQSPYLKK